MTYIPKVIHYCWFGKGEKNDLFYKCYESWKKFFPDYKIIEWNEDNFDINENSYIKEAYACGKWAFVSDYVRLAVIYRYGGIYFDTDVEILKNFEHLLLDYGYLCFENSSKDEHGKTVNTGLGFAAAANNSVIYEIMKDYEDISFLINGSADLTPCPIRNTVSLKRIGLKTDGKMQVLGEMKIYPLEYFCGYDMIKRRPCITENTYTIHHYQGSWEKKTLKKFIKYRIVVPGMQKVLGYEGYEKLKQKLHI